MFEASGFQVAISDDANVPELVARLVNEGHESGVSWDDQSCISEVQTEDARWKRARDVSDCGTLPQVG